MIWIDYAIAGMVAISSTVGAVKGCSRQAFSLICEFAALFVGLGFSRELAYFLPIPTQDPHARLAIAFITLYLLTFSLGRIVRLLLGTLLKSTQLTLVDRSGGILLGMMLGCIWVTAIVILAGLSVLPHSPWWHKANLLPPFQTTALWLQAHFPSDLLENIRYR
ncbi:MAG: colicin V production CvpA [Methylobacter sp.]|uniref:CvpA family protein n=1 Tax=Methylovulum miyakonense TaxID=645578 RepID=UPI000D4F07D8|nr:MAG: colicin V production CvpA [Methylobacter sp.]